MKIKCLVVGELMANCYLLEKDGKVLIIDPGDEFKKIDKVISGEVEEILVTTPARRGANPPARCGRSARTPSPPRAA